mmetsp:Transcript_28663/g.84479  ORF Transcript_28663/g.84479 Transcript_28663/m.84479 type:complete len:378 (+) Transcript_28663:308-1441(+)
MQHRREVVGEGLGRPSGRRDAGGVIPPVPYGGADAGEGFGLRAVLLRFLSFRRRSVRDGGAFFFVVVVVLRGGGEIEQRRKGDGSAATDAVGGRFQSVRRCVPVHLLLHRAPVHGRLHDRVVQIGVGRARMVQVGGQTLREAAVLLPRFTGVVGGSAGAAAVGRIPEQRRDLVQETASASAAAAAPLLPRGPLPFHLRLRGALDCLCSLLARLLQRPQVHRRPLPRSPHSSAAGRTALHIVGDRPRPRLGSSSSSSSSVAVGSETGRERRLRARRFELPQNVEQIPRAVGTAAAETMGPCVRPSRDEGPEGGGVRSIRLLGPTEVVQRRVRRAGRDGVRECLLLLVLLVVFGRGGIGGVEQTLVLPPQVVGHPLVLQ